MASQTFKLQISLLLLRLTVFLVMFIWTIDKFVNPGHAAKIYQHFYFLPGLASVAIYMIGAIELVMVILFLIGYRKKVIYGLILVFHAVSTFSSLSQYLSPFEGTNLLFFAAWPMLAACLTLWLLHDQDKLLCVR